MRAQVCDLNKVMELTPTLPPPHSSSWLLEYPLFLLRILLRLPFQVSRLM